MASSRHYSQEPEQYYSKDDPEFYDPQNFHQNLRFILNGSR